MLYSLLNSKIACYVLTLQAVTLKQFLFCDDIPSYLKMSYVKMSYTIMISLLRNCGDAVIQPPLVYTIGEKRLISTTVISTSKRLSSKF